MGYDELLLHEQFAKIHMKIVEIIKYIFSTLMNAK